MNIGDRIKHFRTKAKMSQVKLAELAEMEPTNINRIEKGKSIPLVTTLLRICNALNVTPNDLLIFEYNAPIELLEGELAKEIKHCNEEEIKQILDYVRFLKNS